MLFSPFSSSQSQNSEQLWILPFIYFLTYLSSCVLLWVNLPVSLHAVSYLYSPEKHTPTLCLNILANEKGAPAVVGDIIFVRHMPIYGSEESSRHSVACVSPRKWNLVSDFLHNLHHEAFAMAHVPMRNGNRFWSHSAYCMRLQKVLLPLRIFQSIILLVSKRTLQGKHMACTVS